MMRNSTETSAQNLVPERFLHPDKRIDSKTSETKHREDKGSLSVLVWLLSGDTVIPGLILA